MKPLIAVAGRIGAAGKVSRFEVAFAGRRYLSAIVRAGGEPVILPPQVLAPDDAADLLDRFDGLYLIGGVDVDPAVYGEPPHPAVYGTNRENDEFECALVRAAVAGRRPTLGVCRGVQIVNVALGGTLHQHVSDLPGLISHFPSGFPAGQDSVMHTVELEPGSRLAKAMDAERPMGASYHHQAVRRIGAGLRPVAWAPDGMVEALEHEHGWCVAVQWHPEETAEDDPVQQRLFDAFVEQAATGR